MNKNILVLTGSPRKSGNSDKMAEAFIKGAEAKGHRITRFDCGRRQINPCKACNGCYSRGTPCLFQDDFNELAPLLEEADVVVLATPLYWFTFSAQLKAALDKMYALVIGKRKLSNRESVLLVCGEDDVEAHFDAIVKTYQHIGEYLNWNNRGVLIAPNVLEKDDIAKTDFLTKAEQMGLSI